MEKKNIKYIWKDKLFLASIIIPVFIWVIYLVFTKQIPSFYFVKNDQLKFSLLVFIIPILEEIVFRGLIQEYLNAKFCNTGIKSISYANLITSILFVSLHLFYQPVYFALLVFIPSIIFGFFKDKYNSLQPPIFLHCFYNAGYFLLIR